MKKVTLLFAGVALVALSSFGQRNVLVEQFTSSTCPPCKPGNENVNSILATKSDYTVVKYQMSWPGSGDPYYTAEGGDRRTYYSVNSVPNLWLDGQWGGNSNSLTDQIWSVFSVMPAGGTMDITERTYNPSTKEVKVSVDINPTSDNSSSGLRLMVAIVENLTTGNVASNGETQFEYVFMKFLGGSAGTTVGPLTNGTTVSKSLVGNMNGTFVEEMTDLRAVVWVEDPSTKSIVNSAWINLQDVATVGIDEMETMSDLSIYPNPFSSTTTVSFDLEESENIAINVYDMAGKLVQEIGNTNYGVGRHMVEIDGNKLQGGMYYVNIVSETGVITRKVVLNK